MISVMKCGIVFLLCCRRNGAANRVDLYHDNRRIVNGFLWILRTGAPWRDLPSGFGPWQSVYTRFRRWKARGIMQQILDQLAQNDTDEESLMIEVSAIRAHQHAAGAKGGRKNRRLDAREEVFLRKSTS